VSYIYERGEAMTISTHRTRCGRHMSRKKASERKFFMNHINNEQVSRWWHSFLSFSLMCAAAARFQQTCLSAFYEFFLSYFSSCAKLEHCSRCSSSSSSFSSVLVCVFVVAQYVWAFLSLFLVCTVCSLERTDDIRNLPRACSVYLFIFARDDASEMCCGVWCFIFVRLEC
jgi:hypothetical protein